MKRALSSNRSNTTYRPSPYSGDGLECIANLDRTVGRQRLLDVAAWHESPHRRAVRHGIIARTLREAAR